MNAPSLVGGSLELARLVFDHGPVSRSDLAAHLGLSLASVTRIAKPLVERGILIETEAESRAAHRPTRPLDVHAEGARFVGVTITARTLEGVVTDLRCAPLGNASVALRSVRVDDVAAQVAALVRDLDAAHPGGPLVGLGVSIGGNVDDGTVTRAPFLGWTDVDLVGALTDATGLPTTVDNDVVALAVAEHWFGVFKDQPDFAIVTIGSGVGYGAVIDNNVRRTEDTGLGLGGHIPLVSDGPRCPAGHPGCAMAVLTTEAIESAYALRSGRTAPYDELLAAARAGEPTARDVAREAAVALGRLLAFVANLAMVNSIVLAGEGCDLWEVAGDVARAELDAYRDPDARPVQVEQGDPRFSAWARGAAGMAVTSALQTLNLSGEAPPRARPPRSP